MNNEEARQELLGGISADADTRAAEVTADAQKAASERMESVKRQAERIMAEAEEKASLQIRAIERDAITRLSAAKRRMQLEMKEKIYQNVIARCTEEFDALIESKGYRNILEDWVVQAAAGLRAEAAIVNCSGPERDDVEAVLESAVVRVREITGKPVALEMSNEPPLAGQGVMVTSADGRTAFNNQINSRLFRFQTAIRKLVHDRLFQDS
jgi:vacuolar-type H+-ATPase subunit E/Vma4